ncbi:MAG: MarC family protein [Nitrospiraceae bacterium]|nr:MarC family protein [Nitrospiraceae bacterium]
MSLFNSLLNTFIPLFVAMDVFAALGIFISLTEGMDRKAVKGIIRDSVLTGLFVSLGFIAVGEAVFRILGITTNDFKIAGGLVLLVVSVRDMLGESERRRPSGNFGIVPIGVPLIVGPAVLTTLIVLVDHYGAVYTIISLIANLAFVWLSFNKAEAVVKVFGKSVLVLSKLMLLMLAAIAVMMIRMGLEGLLAGAH